MLLCVDPDQAARARTRECLEAAGHSVETAGSVSEARDRLATADRVVALVTEYDLPDGTGLEVVAALRETVPDAVAVLYTETAFADVATDGVEGVVPEYVRKDDPDAEALLVDRLEQGLALRSQTAYPLPADEEARLDALAEYATDSAELGAALDRLTELGAALFGVDAATVGLIDEHEERFLSCHGVNVGPLPREDTICTYAILDRDVTVIEDVTEDPRFADNERLSEAGIRFYAGAPVETPEGRTIATFCLYDHEPRSFGERDRELLGLFAAEVGDQLELRRRLAARGDPETGGAPAEDD